MTNGGKSISQAMEAYQKLVRSSRSENTPRTYWNALKIFSSVLADHLRPCSELPPPNYRRRQLIGLHQSLKIMLPLQNVFT